MKSISKTHYTRWRGCAKNAWLSIHKPELFLGIELSEYDRSVMESGIEVEQVARSLFSGGVLVAGSPAEAQRITAEFLAQHTPNLFQAQFQRDGLLAAIDVLNYGSNSDEYSIYEIKSSTKVKEEHIFDLAFQVLLLRQCGLKVNRAFLFHLNPDYARLSTSSFLVRRPSSIYWPMKPRSAMSQVNWLCLGYWGDVILQAREFYQQSLKSPPFQAKEH